MVKVKICGVTNVEDVAMAVESGADVIGMIIDVPVATPRKISLERALEISRRAPSNLPLVAVLMPKLTDEVVGVVKKLKPFAVQLHGYESNDFVKSVKFSLSEYGAKIIKTVHIDRDGNIKHVRDADNYLRDLTEIADFVLVDTITEKMGGTGTVHDWMSTKQVKDRIRPLPLILAGGLTSENVTKAIDIVRPYAVDVASGVELRPGKKDPLKVKSFIKAVRSSEVVRR